MCISNHLLCRMLLNDNFLYRMFLFGKIHAAILLLAGSTILKFLMNLPSFVVI
jgi:hypothetical protein